MQALADIGSVVRVTPQDEIWIVTGPGRSEYVHDFSPFYMCVDGLLSEHGVLFGVYGRVVGGSPRYEGLVASLLVRLDGSDWKHQNSTQANFKVGPGRVERVFEYELWHPEDTRIEGFPVIGRFGRAEVTSAEPVAPHEPPPRASVSDAPDNRTLDSQPAPDSSGGR